MTFKPPLSKHPKSTSPIDRFRHFAMKTAAAVGSPWAFGIALLTVVVWAVTGPIFHFSDQWQLVINTGTTIVTFLMVFLIQSAQNRDGRAIHLKLDELIRGTKGPRNFMVDLEDCTEEELLEFERQFRSLRANNTAKEHMKKEAK